jgi:hypothetical protein
MGLWDESRILCPAVTDLGYSAYHNNGYRCPKDNNNYQVVIEGSFRKIYVTIMKRHKTKTQVLSKEQNIPRKTFYDVLFWIKIALNNKESLLTPALSPPSDMELLALPRHQSHQTSW